MPTSVKTSAMVFPYSLGAIRPGATFASASASLVQNIVPVNNDNVTPDYQFNGIFIQAFPGTGSVAGNLKPIYVCNSAAAPDLTNFTNVIGILQPGDIWPRAKEWANNRSIRNLYIGAENATDFALVTIDQF